MTRRGKNRGGRPSIHKETKDLVCKLYDEDRMTCEQIAKACNISVSSLYNILRERTEVENGN